MGKGLEHDPKTGDFYQHDDGSIYRVIGYQPSPTVILEQLIGPDDTLPGEGRETHAVGCLNAGLFTRLKRVD